MESNNSNKDEYNSIPVFYCMRCLSLRINGECEEFPYCEDCTATDIGLCSIEEWEKKYIEMYGHPYIEKKK